MGESMTNVGILTSTPEGAAYKKALLARAEFVGHMLIETRRFWAGEPNLTPFTEMTHYFDTTQHELGMIAFRDSTVETILIHDPPRMWGNPAFSRCEIRQNLWHKRFDKAE